MTRPSVLVLLAMLIIGGTACVPPEDDSILDDYLEDRIVREIRRSGRMTIAIDDSIQRLGGAAGDPAPSGFAVDVGTAIADELGVEADFVRVGDRDLVTITVGEERGFDEDDVVHPFDADALFVYRPMTERLLRNFTLSDPYFVSHQRLLVPDDAEIGALEDLEGGSVCQILHRYTGLRLDRVVDVRATDGSEASCLRRLGRSSDAIAATELVLYDLISAGGSNLRIVGEDVTTEGYGVFVEPGAAGFASFVSAVIQRAIDDGDWSRWHERWIGDLGGDPAEPPDITAEEAAALFPSDQPLNP